MANWFPPNSAAFLLKDIYYYKEIFNYLSKTNDKFPFRLSVDLDIQKKANWFWTRENNFFYKKLKMNGVKKFDIYSSDNEDDILLQLKSWVVNEEKYKTLMKINDNIEEIF